ncbi:MAG: hypothetical protein ABI811_06070 [Acidobacteriota bacterium]
MAPLADRMLDLIQKALNGRLFHEMIAACLLVVAIHVFRVRYPAFTMRLAQAADGVAERPWKGILLSAALPLVIRLVLLPILPTPEFRVHDEFGHRLVADTLLHGRLANPPLLFREHFEAIYILQDPTYASIYPVGNGAVLALGTLLGHPWIGVWIAMGAMFAAICWMLYAFLPASFALLGGLMSGLLLGTTDWMNTYFGGALVGAGGALIFGALARLIQTGKARYGFILAVGWSMILLARPFEAAILLGFGCLLLLLQIIRGGFRSIYSFRGAAATGFGVFLCTGGFTVLHNLRVTGDPRLTPYGQSRVQYGVPQSFWGQAIIPEPPMPFNDLRMMYASQLAMRRNLDRLESWIARPFTELKLLWQFFLGYPAIIPFVIGFVAVCKRQPALIAITSTGFAASLFYGYFLVHYFAAYTAIIVLMIASGVQILWNVQGRGSFVARRITTFCVIWCSFVPLRYVDASTLAGEQVSRPHHPRTTIARALEKLPGQHLIFVPQEQYSREWVYNDADLNDSKIVWARTLGYAKDSALRQHFSASRAWRLSGDEWHPQLDSYAPAP